MYDRILSPQWIFDRCIEGSFLISDTLGTITVIGLFILLIYWAMGSLQQKKYRFPALFVLIPLSLIWLVGLYMLLGIGASLWMSDLLESLPVSPLYAAVIAFFVILIGGWVILALYRARNSPYWWAKVAAFLLSLLMSVGSYIGVIFAAEFYGCNAYRQYYPAISAAHELHGVMKTWHDAGKPWPANLEELEKLDSKSFKRMMESAKVRYVVDSAKGSFTLFVRPSRYSAVVFDDTSDYRYYQLHTFHPVEAGEYSYPPSYPGPWNEMPN